MKRLGRGPHGICSTLRQGALLACLAALTGCLGNFLRREQPYGTGLPCVLGENPTAEQVAEHLNANSGAMAGWRSTNATVSVQGILGIPVGLSAMVAVEAPKNLRLMVNNPAGATEVDLGSNSGRFWFWTRSTNELMLCQHEFAEVALRTFPIPIQPEWLIEALGVGQIDPAACWIEPDVSSPERLLLCRDDTTPQGGRIHRVIVVNRCHGYIHEQYIRNPRGQTLARAVFKNHRLVTADGPGQPADTGVVLPHVIELHWPMQQTTMTLKLYDIELLSSPMDARMFTPPQLSEDGRTIEIRPPVHRSPGAPRTGAAGERSSDGASAASVASDPAARVHDERPAAGRPRPQRVPPARSTKEAVELTSDLQPDGDAPQHPPARRRAGSQPAASRSNPFADESPLDPGEDSEDLPAAVQLDDDLEAP